MFRVGQKVVCVDEHDTEPDCKTVLSSGRTYTIRWIGPYKHPFLAEMLCVRLFEINPRTTKGWSCHTKDYQDMPFRATRFRPLDERQTDISDFKEALKTTEKEHVMEPD